MKNIFPIFIILLFTFCGQEKEIQNEAGKESVHKEDWKKANAGFENMKIEILENKILVENKIGKFRDPKFSTDGTKIFFTTENFNEIWLYNLKEETLNKIITLPQCGYNFQISEDGENVLFRNKVNQGKKSFSILSYSLKNKAINVIYASDKRLSPPILGDSLIYCLEEAKPVCINYNSKKVQTNFSSPFLFVENNKLQKATEKIDTLKIPNNIEPVESYYSKDLENVFVLTKSIGIIVYSKLGDPINIIKEANYISKLYKSNLIVFTKEVKGEEQKISTKLFIGFLESNKEIEILADTDYQKLYPDWSPIENKIVFATESGDLKIIHFNIQKK
ncbi:MAG: hypothetical protein IPK06_07500 [Ignavibacteriae bacterium]|nr:hypothetical protein [Ignavibacteriota bacterium]